MRKMHREKFVITVGAATRSSRRLLALLAVNEISIEGKASAVERQYSDVMVYLHGFPDLAVHPTKLDIASRLPYKLAEAWLAHGSKRSTTNERDVACLAFNFGGIIGSDQDLGFMDKTISQEVADAVGVCEFVRTNLLQDTGRLHVVGISTGAIIGSLLRSQSVADTISVIAGLADLHSGIHYDFTDDQRRQFDENGTCWKEFYLPDYCDLPTNAIVSFDGLTEATSTQLTALDTVPRKVYLRLHRWYMDECIAQGQNQGLFDIRKAVTEGTCPFLVIHGEADQNVPFADGEALFAAAAEPKQFVAIAKANHLLTNSKHLKKALQAIVTAASTR